jgi:hypothetical protein
VSALPAIMPKAFKAIGGNMDTDKFKSLQEAILQAKEIIKNADAIVITAGAGIISILILIKI